MAFTRQLATAGRLDGPGGVGRRLAAAVLPALAIVLLHLTVLEVGASTGPTGDPATDRITVKGQILNVRIIRFDAKGITYRTEFGTGVVTTAYADLEGVSSRDAFRIVYGDDQEAVGSLIGFKDNRLMISDSPTNVIHVPVESIQVCVLARDYDESWWTRLQTDYRHWRANLSLGVNLEEGAVQKRKLEFGLAVARRKRPTRFVFDFRYAYEIQQTADTPERITKDEFDTFLLGEYDVFDNFYFFLRPAAERDLPRLIRFRFYPAAGAGYRLIEEEHSFLFFPLGIGYVDEDFVDFGDDSYVSAYIGIEGLYAFNNGMVLSGKILYMPDISDPGQNWLFRWLIDFTLPIYDPLALRLRIREENDNNPDPAVGENKFTTSLALVFRF